jgi:hypothetical protein
MASRRVTIMPVRAPDSVNPWTQRALPQKSGRKRLHHFADHVVTRPGCPCEWLFKHDASALTTRYNRDGKQAEAADIIDEVGKTTFKNGAEYAADRFARCQRSAPVDIRSEGEAPIAACFGQIRAHRVLAMLRAAGKSKEESRSAFMAELSKDQMSEAEVARANKVLDWVYMGPPALLDYRLFALFRACIANRPAATGSKGD